MISLENAEEFVANAEEFVAIAEELVAMLESFAQTNPKWEEIEGVKIDWLDRRRFVVSKDKTSNFVYSTRRRTGAKSEWRAIDRDLMVELISECVELEVYARVAEVAKNPRAYE